MKIELIAVSGFVDDPSMFVLSNSVNRWCYFLCGGNAVDSFEEIYLARVPAPPYIILGSGATLVFQKSADKNCLGDSFICYSIS